MSKFGRDDVWILAAAAVLTGLLIFTAGREPEQEQDESGPTSTPRSLAAFRARIPADEPIAVQNARAVQPGRGRAAGSPLAVPWLGWKDILWRTWTGITEDHLLTLAGGVAFFALLAMVPALTAGVSSYALFADARAIQAQLNLLSNIIPPAALDIVRDEIARIAASTDGKLTLSFLGSLALSLWSANAGVKALFEALNIVYGEEEKRSFVTLNAFSMLLTVCSIAGMLIGRGRRRRLAAGVRHDRPSRHQIDDHRVAALARNAALGHGCVWNPLPIWTKPAVGAGPLDYAREFDGSFPLARDVCDVFLVSRPCRQLHRNIRRARRRHRLDDVDLALRRDCPAGSEAQRRNRASDRRRYDHRSAQAVRKPRRCHG